ncbi:ABC transporter ATP-binding protein [Pseudomonas putida]|uniref:ABC transporter ATP-binding protein n=2 Tax=Pseudomonas TaxID=286 RepID=A0A7X3F4L6_9PSED|nr:MULTISPECIES: ABC transporter ATP-binding protein [Pseudomonas]AXQ47757.1 ABC transporter ATP-binding protein [Stenotrophomonas rhizophila]EGC00625.1 spermidine/putrescine ABC transporter ATPase [Pseudomonas sp. TJI-51]EKT4524734.1 ABC transporter ATP-binding protein [Pseudomonas putida]EKY4192126.1 ABC transporter ATP-binding protein [Pseudomonas aeruginosa]ELF6208590.1 ABC transporter ATP-binding protein [Pseudomonas putida]
MSNLIIRGLSKTYSGGFTAVRNLDLEVKSGEFISLLGGSGCGKTTTLQMVAGFISPTTGSVHLGGNDITSMLPEKRDMGIVFQSYALFPHMTVAENVGFGLQMRKVPKQELATRVEEALAMVRLSGLGARYPRELSGGQRQRVAIARVLTIRPSVLLLDEPMSNLDAKLRGEMHVELRALQRRLGITTILVTHDQVEAMTMSDRIAVMADGCIAELGKPQDVYDQPTSSFAMRFLGQTNILMGKVKSISQGQALVHLDGIVVPANRQQLKVGDDAMLFIRPERIRFTPPGVGKAEGRIASRLFLGGLWYYEIESALGALKMTAPNNGERQPQEGETVGIGWGDGDLQVVSAEAAHG